MFQTLFFNVFTVFLMMLPGYIIIRKKLIAESTLKDISRIVLNVLYPSLIFSSITKNFTISSVIQSWQLPVSTFLICVIGYLIGLAYLGFFKDKDIIRKKAILFQFTINNYSFLPLAIVGKLYGDQYMAALILSTLGAEIAVWTIGMSIISSATRQKGEGFQLKNLKHLLSAPLISIYVSMLLLIIMNLAHTTLGNVLDESVFLSYLHKTISQIGMATIPLSMVMVGGRMGLIKFGELKQRDIWGVTFFRLVVIPFVVILVLKNLFPHHAYLSIMLIVAIMPDSINSIMLGELYGSDQSLLSGTVLVTHLFALLLIPLWLLIL